MWRMPRKRKINSENFRQCRTVRPPPILLFPDIFTTQKYNGTSHTLWRPYTGFLSILLLWQGRRDNKCSASTQLVTFITTAGGGLEALVFHHYCFSEELLSIKRFLWLTHTVCLSPVCGVSLMWSPACQQSNGRISSVWNSWKKFIISIKTQMFLIYPN